MRKHCFPLLSFFLLFLLGQASALQFIHITDTHIGTASGVRNLTAFCQLIQSLPEKPDFIIHTGDITEFGTEEQFQTYLRIISTLDIPFYYTLGNHDVRWNGAGWAIAERLFPTYKRNYSFTKEGVTFIALDSSFPYSQYGIIDPSQVSWLKTTLSRLSPDQPLILFIHHPLMPSSNFLYGRNALLEVLKSYNVVLFLTGHGHSNRVWQVDGINFLMTQGMMDANASFRWIKVKDGEIDISVWGLEGKEREGERLRIPLRREKEAISIPAQSSENSELLLKVNGAIQADLVSSGDSVFLCSWSGEVVAVDAKERKETWRKKFDTPILTSPALGRDRLFVAFLNGFVRALDKRTGRVIWEARLPQPVTGHLLAEGEKLFIPATGSLFMLNQADGKILWQRDLGGNLESRPLLVGNTLYIGAWNKCFYAINAENGDVIWQKEIARSIYFSPATCLPTFWDNKLIITQPYDNATKRGGVLALDDKGEIIWQIDGNFGYSTPLTQGDRLFIASMEGKLLCVSPKGEVIWSLNLGSPCFNARPVMEGDRLYLVSFNDVLFVIDAKEGKLIKKMALSNEGCCVSTPVIAGGSIFIGDMMGRLYAIPLSKL